MPRIVTISLGEYYHCYNRGTDQRKIFLTQKDYLRFAVLLHTCNSAKPVHVSNFESKELIELFDVKCGEPIVAIGAWCLMPNHFHLILKEIKEGGISLFMQRLLTAYTMYFNKRSHRKGTLYEGPYKFQHVSEDRYLKYLLSYVHLNPVKLIDLGWKENGIKNRGKAENFLENYEYSSYPDYKGIARQQNKILNKSVFPDYFQIIKDFDQEINNWLSLSQQGKTLP